MRASIELGLPFSEFEQRFKAHDVAILKAFDETFLLGDKKQEYLFAHLLALTANCNRGSDSRPFHPRDFLLAFREPEKEQTEADLKEVMRRLG